MTRGSNGGTDAALIVYPMLCVLTCLNTTFGALPNQSFAPICSQNAVAELCIVTP